MTISWSLRQPSIILLYVVDIANDNISVWPLPLVYEFSFVQ